MEHGVAQGKNIIQQNEEVLAVCFVCATVVQPQLLSFAEFFFFYLHDLNSTFSVQENLVKIGQFPCMI